MHAMARAQLEYDQSGSTFYYFLVSFYGLVLLIATYFLWPRRSEKAKSKALVCQCEPCRRKRALLDVEQPLTKLKRAAKVVVLVVMWGGFAVLVYNVVTLEIDYTEYDPFAILDLDRAATTSEIKRQYRRLSKVYHPDKEGGDQEMFMKIAKAYEALTDEESRKNWELYGNPDGPQAAVFGIALPSWIVEKDNSIWVLGIYVAVFIIGLPVVVGAWWYKSSKYGHTNIYLDTSRWFWAMLVRKQAMPVKQIITNLSCALEFNPSRSKDIKGRPSDDIELNELIRSRALPQLDVKSVKGPPSAPYAVKARILVHAHLERVELPPNTLLIDQHVVLKKTPQLLHEMLNIVTTIWAMCIQQGRKGLMPSLDLFENVMRVSQMVVQGSWVAASPLLQLPHLQPSQLKHFKTRKRNVTTIDQFVQMSNKERRQLVRGLSDEEYLDTMAVCAMFPHVDMQADVKVVDDDDHHKITAGSVVTVTVTLQRQELLDFHGVSTESLLGLESEEKTPVLEEDGVIEPETLSTVATDSHQLNSKKGGGGGGGKAWQKPPRKKKGKAAGSGVWRRRPGAKGGKKEEENKTQREKVEGPEADEQLANDTQVKKADEESDGEVQGEKEEGEKEEEEWDKLQGDVKPKRWYETSDTQGYPVHAPYFPEEKLECWWLYVADRRLKKMIVPPQRITGLRDEQTTDLRFQAPEKPASLRYTVILTSDSYIDLSFHQELKLQVHERVEVMGTAQWRELEEEEEEEEAIEESESEGETEEEEDEDD